MKQQIDLNIIEALEESFAKQFDDAREKSRLKAKEQTLKNQNEDRKYFNTKRKDAIVYNVATGYRKWQQVIRTVFWTLPYIENESK